jgi:hypothetical protein
LGKLIVVQLSILLGLRAVNRGPPCEQEGGDRFERAPGNQFLKPKCYPGKTASRPIIYLKCANWLASIGNVQQETYYAPQPPSATVNEVLRDKLVPDRYLAGRRLDPQRIPCQPPPQNRWPILEVFSTAKGACNAEGGHLREKSEDVV